MAPPNDLNPNDPRRINVEDLEDGDLLAWDATAEAFVRLEPPVVVSIPAAITGGEAPTEAEFNALRTAVANLQAGLLAAGLLKAS